MESGSYVNSSGGGGHIIFVKNNATLDISGGGGSITVYHEPNAIINNTLAGGGSNTFTICATVTFDYSNFTQSLCNTTLSILPPPNNVNEIKVYPNPASTHITIEYGNYILMNGYTLQIINALGQNMFTSPINQQSSYIDLTNWTGNGLYFIQIIDPQSNVVENRKIVKQ